jgi:hypothetical protein
VYVRKERRENNEYSLRNKEEKYRWLPGYRMQPGLNVNTYSSLR